MLRLTCGKISSSPYRVFRSVFNRRLPCKHFILKTSLTVDYRLFGFESFELIAPIDFCSNYFALANSSIFWTLFFLLLSVDNIRTHFSLGHSVAGDWPLLMFVFGRWYRACIFLFDLRISLCQMSCDYAPRNCHQFFFPPTAYLVPHLKFALTPWYFAHATNPRNLHFRKWCLSAHWIPQIK